MFWEADDGRGQSVGTAHESALGQGRGTGTDNWRREPERSETNRRDDKKRSASPTYVSWADPARGSAT